MTKNAISPTSRSALTRPLALTRLGLLAERLTRAFWPLWSILIVCLAALMFGLHEVLPLELLWGVGVLAILGTGAALWRGVTLFRWPSRQDASARLDATLSGRPIAALEDEQAVGAGDEASEAVWAAHRRRMEERVKDAKPVGPDLRLSSRDPYALRYVALVALVMALLFGSIFRATTVTDLARGGGDRLATGPAWEGWIEPPVHTGRPSLYLNDIDRSAFAVPEGSLVTIRLYGEVGALAVAETVSGRTGELPAATDPSQSFEINQAGTLEVAGSGGQAWDITVIDDAPPSISTDGPLERTVTGELRQTFSASDDYGVERGKARIALDLGSISRNYGLRVDPETRETIELDLPMPISGDRSQFSEVLSEDLAKHPWAGLPITLELTASDAIGQVGTTGPQQQIMPGRRFFDPLAQAIVEQRRDLMWSRANAPRVAQMLRAVSYQPDDVFSQETTYLQLRYLIRRLEAATEFDALSEEARDEMADVLWDIALLIEEGDLSDALERLRRAQERLQEAIENGATDEEIAELMQELRDAMQQYMQQLAQQNQQNPDQQAQNQDMETMSQNQLEQMLQELQELMEQGRMEEAQRLLDQLRQMMENMQVTQGQGQGQQSEGQQAMEGLADTLREQQELSDEAFRDLQEQFNPGQQGQQQGQQPGEGQEGQGQNGQQQFGQGQGQNQNGQPGQGLEENLADRQRQLRQELNRQAQNLPGAGTPEGDSARENLGRAGDAMDQAEEALRQDDFAGALDSQSEAIERLREGMRDLAEQMAQQQQEGGQQGQQMGEANPNNLRDPLGREAGENGQVGTDENLLQGDDVYRRARELLDEIRRRSAEQSRPDEELDYLKRLLDRF